MKTKVTELLGIKYPIIQGGMAWVAEYHLAAAVSEAGGLGLIGAASAPADWVRDQIREAKKLTDKPFGVNIMLMSPYADDVANVVVEEGVKVVTTGSPHCRQRVIPYKFSYDHRIRRIISQLEQITQYKRNRKARKLRDDLPLCHIRRHFPLSSQKNTASVNAAVIHYSTILKKCQKSKSGFVVEPGSE